MVKYFIYLQCLVFSSILYAQSGFGEAQFIDNYDFQVTKVNTSDIDGDGDIDILFIAQNEDTVAWYENLDGQGTFGSVHYVDQNLNFTQSLSTADFNGDGDMDILATSAGDDKAVWYENLDGQGNFSSPNIIANFIPNAKQAIAADFDNDNDMDVVVAISDASKVVWYENLNGQGDFSDQHIISNTTIGVYSLDVADVDGDGFLDVLTNSSSIGYPSWFKNVDGQGNFGPENLIDLIGTFKLKTADIDGDNDQDLFKMESTGGQHTIHWLENTDGLGTFLQKQTISNYNTNTDLFATDVDNDGDIDLLVTYVGDGKIAWFENLDGLGTFGERRVIDDFKGISVVAADIDGDGYKDIVTSIDDLMNLVWYKNLTYLGINDPILQNVVLVPNPTNGIVYLQNLSQPIMSIAVYNVLGKMVLQQKSTANSIDISSLQIGLYLIKIETDQGIITKKVIKE